MFFTECSNFSKLSLLADRKTPIVKATSKKAEIIKYGNGINKIEIKKNKVDLIRTWYLKTAQIENA